MSTSRSTAFPAATTQVSLIIVKPCSGWPIHKLSVKLVMFCIEYCFREDWVWNYLFCNSNLAGLPFSPWLGPCFFLFFFFSFNYPLGQPEQLPVKPSLSVDLIPKLKSKKDYSKPLDLNKLRNYIMLRNSSHGWQSLHNLVKFKNLNTSVTYPRALSRDVTSLPLGNKEQLLSDEQKDWSVGCYSVAIKVKTTKVKKKIFHVLLELSSNM